jgi:MtN3 and saliva related transmembrane protein
MVLELTQILGLVATILFSVMLIPQIIKTIKQKNTKGISLWLFLIFFLANIIALIYAFMINQLPLIIKYVLGITESIFYITIFLIYHHKGEY